MDGVGLVTVVDESNHCLTTLAVHDGRTRCDAIISDKTSLSKVRVDLRFKWLDVDLVVIDGWVVIRLCGLLNRRNGKRVLVKPFVWGTIPVFGSNELGGQDSHRVGC